MRTANHRTTPVESRTPTADGLPAFGGTPFASDAGTGHSDYWNIQDGRMNASLKSIGNIIVGQQPAG